MDQWGYRKYVVWVRVGGVEIIGGRRFVMEDGVVLCLLLGMEFGGQFWIDI